jgi:hypothetical protein
VVDGARRSLAILVSLFISFPRISFFLGNDPQIVSNWSIIRSQARDPLSMSADQLANQASHASKLAFRLTVPMIVRVLHIDWPGVLALQFCLGVALLFLAGKTALDLFGDRIVAVATIFGVSAIYAGKAAFLQLGGFFDAFAYFFLTLAIAFRNPVLIAIAVLAASFTDERAMVIARWCWSIGRSVARRQKGRTGSPRRALRWWRHWSRRSSSVWC